MAASRSNATYSAPTLSKYFARLTPECNILKAECEFVIMGIFVYSSSKEIIVWNKAITNCEKSRGNLIDVMLTDGFHYRKIFLCPRTSLEDMVLTNKLYVGKKIKLKHCSLNTNAANPECSIIAVHELDIVGDAIIPDIGTLNPDPLCKTLQQLTRNFIPILEDKITFFDIWFNNIPRWPPEEMFGQTFVSDEQFLKAVTVGPFLNHLHRECEKTSAGRTFYDRPIIVRVVSKDCLFSVDSVRGINCPYLSSYRVVDASGTCTMMICNEGNVMYNRIQQGTLLYLSEYHVKLKDRSSLTDHELSMLDKCKNIPYFPIEIIVMPILKNQYHMSEIPIKILDGAPEEIISKHVPLPMFNFLRVGLERTALVDIVGVVVGLSRYVRLRQKNYELIVSRWLEVVCVEEPRRVLSIHFAIRQQVAEHVNLKLGELVVITNLKWKQWNASLSYLEYSRSSQIIGYSKRNHDMLCRHKEYMSTFDKYSNGGYIDGLLGTWGWLGGSYNIIGPPDYDSARPFLPITPCDQWQREISSLSVGEIKPILVRARIVRVVLYTATGILPTSGKVYSWQQNVIYQSSTLNVTPNECYGSERPHVKTFPVFYDVNSYLWKLETMQFSPLDLDEWFAKQERMNHPYFKKGHEPTSVPVSYICIHVLSSAGDKMFICCFPIYCYLKSSEHVNLKQLLGLKCGAQLYGARLIMAEKIKPRSNVLSDNLCAKLKSDAESVCRAEVLCMLEVCRIEADAQPEIILRKVFFDD